MSEVIKKYILMSEWCGFNKTKEILSIYPISKKILSIPCLSKMQKFRFSVDIFAPVDIF